MASGASSQLFGCCAAVAAPTRFFSIHRSMSWSDPAAPPLLLAFTLTSSLCALLHIGLVRHRSLLMRPDGLMTRTTATAVCQQWYHGIKHNMKLKNDQIFTHFEESIAKLS